MSHTAQLAVFIRGVSEDFEITKEMLGLQPMKGTTQDTDLFTSSIELLNKFKLELTNLAGVATDGCIKQRDCCFGEKSKGHKNVMHYHCIIHQQYLCARGIGFKM